MGRFRKSSYTNKEFHNGQHRFEHWYRDNTAYFITSRTRDGSPAFASDRATAVFWDRFNHYATQFGFDPWVTTLLNNHYHTVGLLKVGENLGPFMQRLHGSVAKLVNDTLEVRLAPFWRTAGNKDYFDGCLRNEAQLCRAYRYTLLQAVRARVVRDWRAYPNTRVVGELKDALARAHSLNLFLEDVSYARYDGRRDGEDRGR